MLARNFSARRVDDEIDVAVLDTVENVRASLVNLEDLGYFDFRFRQRVCRSACGNDFKAKFHKLARNWDHRFLVSVLDADEDLSFFRQRRRRSHLRLRVRKTKIDI